MKASTASLFVLAAGVCLLTMPAAAQQVSREQDIADLRLGQRVLVDDGSCPAGQIKEVSGSQMTTTGVLRTRKCIPRLDRHQLPYLPTIPRQTASRSGPRDSLPTLAFLATAVTTITSLSSGSTKID
jgi:hypothetical protein